MVVLKLCMSRPAIGVSGSQGSSSGNGQTAASSVDTPINLTREPPLIVAMGFQSEHWLELGRANLIDDLIHCSINVKSALRKGCNETTDGTGLDDPCARRIRAKPLYQLLKDVGLIVLDRLGMLIVVCNHGKHRSVALARDLATHTNGEFLAPCCKEGPLHGYYIAPRELPGRLSHWLRRCKSRVGRWSFPVKSVGVCVAPWNGPAWGHAYDSAGSYQYHIVAEDDRIIELFDDPIPEDPQGWVLAMVIARDGYSRVDRKWIPPYVYAPNRPADFMASISCDGPSRPHHVTSYACREEPVPQQEPAPEPALNRRPLTPPAGHCPPCSTRTLRFHVVPGHRRCQRDGCRFFHRDGPRDHGYCCNACYQGQTDRAGTQVHTRNCSGGQRRTL